MFIKRRILTLAQDNTGFGNWLAEGITMARNCYQSR